MLTQSLIRDLLTSVMLTVFESPNERTEAVSRLTVIIAPLLWSSIASMQRRTRSRTQPVFTMANRKGKAYEKIMAMISDTMTRKKRFVRKVFRKKFISGELLRVRQFP